MSSSENTSERPTSDAAVATAESGGDESAEGKSKPPLQLEVQVTQPGACQRHVTVTISREDIDRYMRDAVNELLPKAEVPGFRPGRAPRKLIEHRFKDQVRDQVKSSLLMESMTQVNEMQQFTAISEPSINVDAIVLPDTGPMTYEFDLEVRPDFDLPEWKGLKLDRPVHEYTDEETDKQFARVMERFGSRTHVEGGAEPEHFVVANAQVRVGDELLAEHNQIELRVRPTITFRDARIEDGLKLLVGAKAGDVVEGKLRIARGSESTHAGKEADVRLEVVAVEAINPPELTPTFLDAIGGFGSVEEVRDFLRGELNRQLEFHRQRQIRQQITGILTASANWDLPPDLLRRQSRRELDRAILEMRSNKFSDDQIRSYVNQMRENILESTSKALKEHFILERIAEQEKVEAEPQDYDDEIRLIADQSDESPRRVRARLEKRGQMDTLRNQIIERKVIGLITAAAQLTDTPYVPPVVTDFAVDLSLCEAGDESEIPEAKFGESGGDTQMPSTERK